MRGEQVLEIVHALRGAGLQFWLDGGWGIDALLATQTRDHQDVDFVVELIHVIDVLDVLETLGLTVVEDHLPTRMVVQARDGRRADLHPVTFDIDGTGWQSGASPDGSDCPYPPDGFGEGVVLGMRVPCLTAALQVEHHRGFEPREIDRHDMSRIAAAFNIDLPAAYSTDPTRRVADDSR